ncbi:hypothetical protein CG740_23340 [Streptomyces sp. CB01201]|uniref:hypothetical protein n=1 Tax=Streptomyces sp. CB01201 TaxID=2020324 RepID=UPI000C27001F|nr:hypothetical protein [Streptomyces sp. CB01201]PJN00840.1 hypothetical protein CG740_23340 [Streptomyces sp. CB01201]
MTDPIEDRLYDAIEYSLWADLADALNRIEEYGLDPIAGLCEQLHATPVHTIDAGDVIHGGGVRKPGGYLLRNQSCEHGWAVAERAGTEGSTS